MTGKKMKVRVRDHKGVVTYGITLPDGRRLKPIAIPRDFFEDVLLFERFAIFKLSQVMPRSPEPTP